MEMEKELDELNSRAWSGETGRAGWILLWALGVPIPVLLVLFALRGCT